MLQRYKENLFRSSDCSNPEVLDEHYYFSQMRPLIRESLSFEQEQEIKSILKRAVKVPSKKLVDVEVCFWFFRRFYVVFYLGFDRRLPLRFWDARQQSRVVQWLANTVVGVSLWISTLFVLVMVLYYMKSTIGIDFVPHNHANEVIENAISEHL